MASCLQGEPEAVEPFMPLTRRTERCFGRCQWRTVIPAHQRLLAEMSSFLTPARSHMLLTPQPVSNCGITTRVAKEAVARRPSYTQGKFTSVTIIVTRQVVSC